MTWHLSKIEAAFGAARVIDPADVPNDAWIDLSDDVADWAATRGRSDELGEFVGVDGSISLDNADEVYSPEYNPDPTNLLSPALSTAGSSLAGVMPDSGVLLVVAAGGVAFAVVANNDLNFMYPFAYDVNVTAGFVATQIGLYFGGSSDIIGAKHDVRHAMRVNVGTTYRMRLQHKLQSGTGQAIRMRVYWLDSNGTVLSFTDSSNFTPTGTVTQQNLTGLTPPAGAKYANFQIQWAAVLAATQRVRFSAIQFGAYSNNTMVSFGYFPNIRPGVPLRMKLRDSADSTYRPIFYGHAGDWEQDPNELISSVNLLDGFELLAGMDLETASDEITENVGALVSVPFTDPSETRKKFRVFAPDDPNIVIERTIANAPNAADLSEYAFGEPGPQDGIQSVRFDPESELIGYCAQINPPDDRALWPPAGGAPTNDWWLAFWFRIKRKEHDGRTHYLFTAQHRLSTNNVADIVMTGTGTVYAHVNGASGSDDVTPITTGKFHDGEWHLAYLEFADDGPDYRLKLRLDYPEADGEEVLNSTVSSLWTWKSGKTDMCFGGYPDPGTVSFRNFMRGWISQARWGRGILTDAQQEALYRTGAPPAITSGETEVERIDRVLDFAGWPATMRDLDPAVAVVNGPYPSGTNALEAIKQIAESAGGVIWIDKSGLLRYSNRRARYNPTTTLTCSHALTTMPEDDLKPIKGLDWVYNRVTISRAVGDPIVVDDLESQAQHGIRTLDLDMPLLDDEDALQAGYWHLHLYAQPKARIGSLTFKASATNTVETLWDFLVNAELMSASAIELSALQLAGHQYLIEQIKLEMDADEKLFQGTLEVSPGDAYQAICVFDASNFDDCIFGW